jgi:hypothetical protein
VIYETYLRSRVNALLVDIIVALPQTRLNKGVRLTSSKKGNSLERPLKQTNAATRMSHDTAVKQLTIRVNIASTDTNLMTTSVVYTGLSSSKIDRALHVTLSGKEIIQHIVA